MKARNRQCVNIAVIIPAHNDRHEAQENGFKGFSKTLSHPSANAMHPPLTHKLYNSIVSKFIYFVDVIIFLNILL